MTLSANISETAKVRWHLSLSWVARLEVCVTVWILYFQCRVGSEWNLWIHCLQKACGIWPARNSFNHKEFVKCLTKLTNCITWCFPAPLEMVWGKTGIQELRIHLCVTKLPLQHLEKRKPSDLGDWLCHGLSPVAGMCFSFLNTAAKQLTLQRAASTLVLGCKSPATSAPAYVISLGLPRSLKDALLSS